MLVKCLLYGVDNKAEFLRAEAASYSQDGFLTMALKFVDEAMGEREDEPPPICVVQAIIIATHCQLTKGVHGKAWRLLGTCVRLAYELNLHLVDALDGPPKMGARTCTIRRTPTAIAWAHMETMLPVDYADWFQSRPSLSAFMEPDPVQRWKALHETGNHSPKAWFLVINSLMKDAQIISSPRGVPFQPHPDRRQRAKSFCRKSKGPRVNPVEKSRQTLDMLANSVQCFTLALPQHLKYHNQYLGFDPAVAGQAGSMRQRHCGIYNIYIMTQLAQLMIHRFDMFGSHTQFSQSSGAVSSAAHLYPGHSPAQRPHGFQDSDNLSVRQYFETADNILMIVNRSCEDHIQHINPFLSSTIWLAAAVQLVRNYISTDDVNPGLIKSRFDVLYLTYKRCVEFWDTKTAMEQNLESFEMQLEGQQPPPARDGGDCRRQTSRPGSGKQNENGPPADQYTWRASPDQRRATPGSGELNKEPEHSNKRAPTDANNPASLPQFMSNSQLATGTAENCTSHRHMSPIHAATGSSRTDYLKSHGLTLPLGDGNLSVSHLDFMQTARGDGRPLMGLSAGSSSSMATLGMSSAMMNTALYYGQGLQELELQHELERRSLELPIDIHDVLSGLTSY